MPLDQTLESCLYGLRAETRKSLNPASNFQVQDQQIYALQRTQQWLWVTYDWPLLRATRYVPMQEGQRYYQMPADLDITRIEHVSVRNDRWVPVGFGISKTQQYPYDSDLGEQSWPPYLWDISEDRQVEVYPIPDRSGVVYDTSNAAATIANNMKFVGIRNLRPFVDMADRCDFDDYMLILYTAGYMLAASGSKDAQLKLDEAAKIRRRLIGNQSPRKVMAMPGNEQYINDCIQYERIVAVYNAPTS